MADQVFRSIAAEAKRIPTWDVETILTRAVYRALNNNSQFTQALDHPPVNVDKCLSTTDAQLQLRLVAEKLCKRVERRYEKRLLQQRERDRAETDRKLNDIRNEYSEQMEVRRRDLERERVRLEDEFSEKERNLRHKIELHLAEKENVLEITRKTLETRLTELTLSKEHLDRAKAEFHAKFTSDVEMLNREWERLSGKKEELRAVFQQEFEAEQRQLKGRLFELEKENMDLKKKISESGAELFESRSKLSKFAAVEEDLQIANERLRKEMEENHRLSRLKYEMERLREENAFLKEEIEQLKSISREPKASSSQKDSLKFPGEEVYQVKIRELKTVIKLMNDKIASVSSERDYLRDMLRAARKDVFRETAAKRKEYASGKAITSFSSHKILRNTDSSEETSMSSSSLSERGADLRNIQERFATLENLARTLDTTIDCVAVARSMTHDEYATSPALSTSENYDEFCRSLKKNVNLYSSPVKKVGEEISQSPAINNQFVSSSQGAPRPGVEQHGEEDETPRVVALTDSARRRSSAAQRNLVSLETAEEQKTPVNVPLQGESSDPVPAGLSFAEKLKARNEASRKLKFSLAPEKSNVDEQATSLQNVGSSSSPDNSMAKYMALVMKQGANDEQKSTPKTDQPAVASLPFEVDDVHVDKPGDSGDEIEW
ncbi:hypothetical protein Y032_0004g1718 [Ancylostoma ceylanicum]|uniref:Uncharacterized protein n=1 Tax=Ancylostoma ceylanicum TaxID=53326 RepID=A0A016VSY5_9BILA|nr:hypothetical protein Y032_0004g1718 [Ancylostoma ceylanicum]